MEMIEQKHLNGRIKKIKSFSIPRHRQYDSQQILRACQFSREKNHFAIELGCGTGLHSLNFARSHPNWNMIAIEKTREKSAKFFEQWKLAGSMLKNLWPIHDNAIDWLSGHMAGPVVDNIFILYPNPYPKEKQANKRWHNMPFMGWMTRLLKPRGLITVATNEHWYIRECHERMENMWNMSLVKSETISSPRTLFEKKYLERGQNCYQHIYSILK